MSDSIISTCVRSYEWKVRRLIPTFKCAPLNNTDSAEIEPCEWSLCEKLRPTSATLLWHSVTSSVSKIWCTCAQGFYVCCCAKFLRRCVWSLPQKSGTACCLTVGVLQRGKVLRASVMWCWKKTLKKTISFATSVFALRDFIKLVQH